MRRRRRLNMVGEISEVEVEKGICNNKGVIGRI